MSEAAAVALTVIAIGSALVACFWRRQPGDAAPDRAWAFHYIGGAWTAKERARREKYVVTLWGSVKPAPKPIGEAMPKGVHGLSADEIRETDAAIAHARRTGQAIGGDLFDVPLDALRRDNETEAEIEARQERDEARRARAEEFPS